MLNDKQIHFLKYFLTVLLGFIIDWSVWLIFLKILHNPIYAQIISRFFSSVFGFYMIKKIVFSHIEKHYFQFIKYVLAVIFAWFMSVLFISFFHFYFIAFISKLFSDILIFIINYFIMNYIVFTNDKTSSLNH